eukprot:TRINITY_DN3849_c0_g1_i1.p1 TRINITY_DN3849_c0_g1~~TRINITY_DN3849_c0_g1_i1.p1  ORF type:complete len:111 (+),score=30.99 TRINITY_DN3849_c0_g1_i1:71-403(+)
MGITKTLIKKGTGVKIQKGNKVTVHCTGVIKETGKKFWSTHDGNKPFSFQIGRGQVIRAWDEGVLDMEIGEVTKIEATPDWAYGSTGFPEWGIYPNSILIFEIEVLSQSN